MGKSTTVLSLGAHSRPIKRGLHAYSYLHYQIVIFHKINLKYDKHKRWSGVSGVLVLNGKLGVAFAIGQIWKILLVRQLNMSTPATTAARSGPVGPLQGGPSAFAEDRSTGAEHAL